MFAWRVLELPSFGKGEGGSWDRAVIRRQCSPVYSMFLVVLQSGQVPWGHTHFKHTLAIGGSMNLAHCILSALE